MFVNFHNTNLAALLISAPPVYSGNVFERGDFAILLLKTSILLRNRIIDVRLNHRELTTDSKRTRDSLILFYFPAIIRECVSKGLRSGMSSSGMKAYLFAFL